MDYSCDIEMDFQETADDFPPDLSRKREHDERYKRKVSNRLRSCYQVFCPYGRSREKRHVLWKAMKWANWHGHCRRGWYDRMFIKKLHNTRVRYTKGSLPMGGYYRKITRKCCIDGWEQYDATEYDCVGGADVCGSPPEYAEKI